MVWQKQTQPSSSFTKVAETGTTFSPEARWGFLLCEDDSFLLQEDDFKIVLEWYWLHNAKTTGSYGKVTKPSGSWNKIPI